MKRRGLASTALVVQAAYAVGGVSLPRRAQDRYEATTELTVGDPSEPGDLVFFGVSTGEVFARGIYIGEGQIVDAPHTGADVRVEPFPAVIVQPGDRVLSWGHDPGATSEAPGVRGCTLGACAALPAWMRTTARPARETSIPWFKTVMFGGKQAMLTSNGSVLRGNPPRGVPFALESASNEHNPSRARIATSEPDVAFVRMNRATSRMALRKVPILVQV